MGLWTSWVRQPQTLWVRRAVFQVHLWTGIVVGLYITVMCVTGSVLVYRNELYRAFSSEGDGPLPFGFRATAWLLDLHDNLLWGETGRRVNAVGAALVIVLGVTGLVVWWPGISRWRRSVRIDLRARGPRFTWSLHSALGIWFVAFVLMWGLTGLYLSAPTPFNDIADVLQPLDDEHPVERGVDQVLYWLGYAHFGRFGNRLPGCGRGACHSVFEALWASIALVPVVLAWTGALMWWRRGGHLRDPQGER